LGELSSYCDINLIDILKKQLPNFYSLSRGNDLIAFFSNLISSIKVHLQ